MEQQQKFEKIIAETKELEKIPITKKINLLLNQLLVEYPDRLGMVLEVLSKDLFQVRISTENSGIVFNNYGEAIEFAMRNSIDNPNLILSIDQVEPGSVRDLARFKDGLRTI